MADYILVSAQASKKGKGGIYAVIVRERDSEVISDDEKKMQLLYSAHEDKAEIVGPIFLQYLSDDDHAHWRDRYMDLHHAAEAKAAQRAAAVSQEKP